MDTLLNIILLFFFTKYFIQVKIVPNYLQVPDKVTSQEHLESEYLTHFSFAYMILNQKVISGLVQWGSYK